MNQLIAMMKPSRCSGSPTIDNTTMTSNASSSLLESLPSEILHYILTFLPPVTLARFSATSHTLRSHAHDELLWEALVRLNVPSQIHLPSPVPAKSWRELYQAHHLYWFLSLHKLWFSDQEHSGSLLLARYNHEKGSIEAYRVLARQILPVSQLWSISQQWAYDPSVHIHEFRPEVRLWLSDPVVKLNFKEGCRENLLRKEISMETGVTPGVQSYMSLCCRITPDRQYASMAVWPPASIPATERVRNKSPNKFRHESARTKSPCEASDRAFRIRKSMGLFNYGLGEEVSTWSTLSEDLYKPTEQKPWQGIWVGDYSAHGCEFLLVMQRDKGECPTLCSSRRSSTDSGLPSGVIFADEEAASNSVPLPPVEEAVRYVFELYCPTKPAVFVLFC